MQRYKGPLRNDVIYKRVGVCFNDVYNVKLQIHKLRGVGYFLKKKTTTFMNSPNNDISERSTG